MSGESGELWVVGGTALTMDQAGHILEDPVIRVSKGRIAQLGNQSELDIPLGAKVLDTKGCLVLPGLVNGHTHSAMSLFRGIADDLPLMPWLEQHIFPLEKKWGSPEFSYLGTLLACAEMIRTGTATFNDMYYYEDSVARASHEAGLRAICGQTIMENKHVDYSSSNVFESMDRLLSLVESFPLVYPAVAPHSIYCVSFPTWEKVITYARDRKIRIQVHVSETGEEVEKCKKLFGKTPVQLLDSLSLWSLQVTAAHVVCLTQEDIATLGKYSVGVSHNIESNLKIGTGISPVIELRKAGVHVSLGTDGVASNNNLDLFQEVDTAAKMQSFQKGPGALKAKEAVEMLTIEGARALYLGDETGSLEIGKSADIIAVDLQKPHLVPWYDPYSLLVYSVNGADVKHNVVNGRILMKNYRLTTLDEEVLIKEALAWGRKIRKSRVDAL